MDRDTITNRFIHHPPTTDDVIKAHELTRQTFENLAQWINSLIPDCDEKDKAIDAIDLAAMYTNAGIARTQLQRQALTG